MFLKIYLNWNFGWKFTHTRVLNNEDCDLKFGLKITWIFGFKSYSNRNLVEQLLDSHLFTVWKVSQNEIYDEMKSTFQFRLNSRNKIQNVVEKSFKNTFQRNQIWQVSPRKINQILLLVRILVELNFKIEHICPHSSHSNLKKTNSNWLFCWKITHFRVLNWWNFKFGKN